MKKRTILIAIVLLIGILFTNAFCVIAPENDKILVRTLDGEQNVSVYKDGDIQAQRGDTITIIRVDHGYWYQNIDDSMFGPMGVTVYKIEYLRDLVVVERRVAIVM